MIILENPQADILLAHVGSVPDPDSCSGECICTDCDEVMLVLIHEDGFSIGLFIQARGNCDNNCSVGSHSMEVGSLKTNKICFSSPAPFVQTLTLVANQ